jgi:hypothetical protein
MNRRLGLLAFHSPGPRQASDACDAARRSGRGGRGTETGRGGPDAGEIHGSLPSAGKWEMGNRRTWAGSLESKPGKNAATRETEDFCHASMPHARLQLLVVIGPFKSLASRWCAQSDLVGLSDPHRTHLQLLLPGSDWPGALSSFRSPQCWDHIRLLPHLLLPEAHC